MNAFGISVRAERDLNGTWEYIAENSPTTATRFVNRIEEQCQLLADNPMMGRLRPELGPYVRSFRSDNQVIFYAPHRSWC